MAGINQWIYNTFVNKIFIVGYHTMFKLYRYTCYLLQSSSEKINMILGTETKHYVMMEGTRMIGNGIAHFYE